MIPASAYGPSAQGMNTIGTVVGAPMQAMIGGGIGGVLGGGIKGLGLGAIGGAAVGGLAGALGAGPVTAAGGALAGGGAGALLGVVGGGLLGLAAAIPKFSASIHAASQAAMGLSQRFRGESLQWAKYQDRMRRFYRDLNRREAAATEEYIPVIESITKGWSEFTFNVKRNFFDIFGDKMKGLADVTGGMQVYLKDKFEDTMMWLEGEGAQWARGVGKEDPPYERLGAALFQILVPENIGFREFDEEGGEGMSFFETFGEFFGPKEAENQRDRDSEKFQEMADKISSIEALFKKTVGGFFDILMPKIEEAIKTLSDFGSGLVGFLNPGGKKKNTP